MERNLMLDYNQAVLAIYDIFLDIAVAVSVDELKERGFSVKEIALSPDPSSWDKLYVLEKDQVIRAGCSLIIKDDLDIDVKHFNPLECKELLRRVISANGENPAAGKNNLN